MTRIRYTGPIDEVAVPLEGGRGELTVRRMTPIDLADHPRVGAADARKLAAALVAGGEWETVADEGGADKAKGGDAAGEGDR